MSLRRSRLTNAVPLPGIAVPTVDFSALSIQDCRPLDKKPNFCPSEAEVEVASAYNERFELAPIRPGHEGDSFLAFQDVLAVGVSSELRKLQNDITQKRQDIVELTNDIEIDKRKAAAETLFELQQNKSNSEPVPQPKQTELADKIAQKEAALQILEDVVAQLEQKIREQKERDQDQAAADSGDCCEESRKTRTQPITVDPITVDDLDDLDLFMITKRWVSPEKCVNTFIPAAIPKTSPFGPSKYVAYALEGFCPEINEMPFREVFFGIKEPGSSTKAPSKTPPPPQRPANSPGRLIRPFTHFEGGQPLLFSKKDDLIKKLGMITLGEAEEAMNNSETRFESVKQEYENMRTKKGGPLPEKCGIIAAFIATQVPYENRYLKVQVPILFKIEWPNREIRGYELAYINSEGKGYLEWKRMSYMPDLSPLRTIAGRSRDAFETYPETLDVDEVRKDSNPVGTRATNVINRHYNPLFARDRQHDYAPHHKYLFKSIVSEMKEYERLNAPAAPSRSNSEETVVHSPRF